MKRNYEATSQSYGEQGAAKFFYQVDAHLQFPISRFLEFAFVAGFAGQQNQRVYSARTAHDRCDTLTVPICNLPMKLGRQISLFVF